MEPEDDFGDFSSAFPSNETSESQVTSNNFVAGDVVFAPGQESSLNDNFTSNWGFDDFPVIPFHPSMHIEATAPDIHTLPDDFQLLATTNTEQPTCNQSITAQQPQTTAVSHVHVPSDDFGDFESSSVQAESCNAGNDNNSSMALHSVPGTVQVGIYFVYFISGSFVFICTHPECKCSHT